MRAWRSLHVGVCGDHAARSIAGVAHVQAAAPCHSRSSGRSRLAITTPATAAIAGTPAIGDEPRDGQRCSSHRPLRSRRIETGHLQRRQSRRRRRPKRPQPGGSVTRCSAACVLIMTTGTRSESSRRDRRCLVPACWTVARRRVAHDGHARLEPGRPRCGRCGSDPRRRCSCQTTCARRCRAAEGAIGRAASQQLGLAAQRRHAARSGRRVSRVARRGRARAACACAGSPPRSGRCGPRPGSRARAAGPSKRGSERKTAQPASTELALADVRVAVDVGAQRRLRVVEVQRAQALEADLRDAVVKHGRPGLLRTDLVPGGQQVAGVQAQAPAARRRRRPR